MSIRLSLPVLILAAGITGVPGHGDREPSSPAGAFRQFFSAADLDYVRGVHYFLYDPNLDRLGIENTDIEVYLDDYNYSNDQNSIYGRAFVDTSLTCDAYGDPARCDTTSVRGVFTLLFQGADSDYEILDVYGPQWKVIRLRRQLTGDQRLGVAFRARRVIGSDPTPFEVGQRGTLTTPDEDGVRRKYLKLLRAPASIVKPGPDGFFVRDSVFALTRDLELKNFYQLPGQRIDPNSFSMTIRKGVDDPPVTSIQLEDGTAVPYLEVLGLDSWDESQTQPVPGHDGRVDNTYLSPSSQLTFIDYENGILFFPDPRPFAPRLGDPLYPFDQSVSNVLLRRDSLVGPPDSANGANVAIYDKYHVRRSLDAVYYIDFEFRTAYELVPDSVVLSMSAVHWVHSSPPLRKNGFGLERSILEDAARTDDQFQQRNAEVGWFTTLSAVKERDLNPDLTDAEGAQTSHPSLAISVPRRPRNAGASDTLWAGLTYPLDPVGLDLSRALFIDVWVNDFNDAAVRLPTGANRGMKLHVSLGRVSEDQMRSPDEPPNRMLDTEDRSEGGAAPDRQLDATEDTGYDRLADAEEIASGLPIRDLTTASAADPQGDDFHPVSNVISPDDIDPDAFRGSNGTENNRALNPSPDTEDLNLDNLLQTGEDVFDYTIELCDTCRTYLVTNVREEFPIVSPDNGWRRYRIPIADTLRTSFGTPDLMSSRQVRVWLEGIMETDSPGRPLLMLGGLKIVGSHRLTIAQESVLGAIKPNPFRTDVEVAFTLGRAGPVDLLVYDVLGREVRAVARGLRLGAGAQSLRWDGREAGGREAGAGVYFMRLKTEHATWTRTVVRVR